MIMLKWPVSPMTDHKTRRTPAVTESGPIARQTPTTKPSEMDDDSDRYTEAAFSI